MNDPDDYDVFLQTWEPSELLDHACLPSNLGDPLVQKSLIDDMSATKNVLRTPYKPGHKVMDDDEIVVRGLGFFQEHQQEWSQQFRDYVLFGGVAEAKFDIFATGFAKLWVDGKSRRQDSPTMMSIKASIREFDRLHHPHYAGKFVITPVNDDAEPLFTPEEMLTIFKANEGLLQSFMPDYLDHLGGQGSRSFGDIFVRRGVRMPEIGAVRQELYYLSSYSLTLGPVEQFAQTWTDQTKLNGVSSVFSAPLAAVQNRVVVFAPFIPGMDLSQLELVVAPPIEPMPLQYEGEFGGLHDYTFY